ncbi:MAG TPA: hypothetical protein VGS20_14190 [Candidatus Acidoferrales bacterium]|nr:hypothetical protein [Candidatus Acidoferrales bacterium]
MRATRTRPAGRRRAPARSTGKPQAQQGPPVVLYRVCKSGWAVVAEKVPTAPDTRFVCPFCPRSHRVPGPVRGFRRVRRAQWLKLRRVFE